MCVYIQTHIYICTCLSVVKNILTKLSNFCEYALFNPCDWLIFSRPQRFLFLLQAVFVSPQLLPLQSLFLSDLNCNKLKPSTLMRSTA